MPFSDPSPALKTAGELERQLSQNVILLYRSQSGYAPKKVICHLFGNQLAVLIEGALLPAEQILFDAGKEELSSEIRGALRELYAPKFEELIQAVLNVGIITLLSDTCFRTQTTSIVAILSKTPRVRNPEVIPKTKLFRKSRLQNEPKG